MASKRVLSIYLLRESFVSNGTFLEADPAPESHAIKHGRQTIGTLYIRQSGDKRPGWCSLFETALPGKLDRLKNRTTAAVLVVPAGGRVFALTFGYGRFLLAPGSWEESFGLKVTLNSVDPRGVRSIDKKSFDTLVSHTRTQGSREGTPIQLGIDAERDLLRAATGKPTDETLGRRLAGMDALSAAVAVELSGIPTLLERYLKQSNETAYRKSFPWVDQVREIGDASTIAHLDSILVDRIAKQDLDRLWLAVPELVDWAEVEGFAFRSGSASAVHGDLDIKDFVAESDGHNVDVDDLRRARVYQINAADGAATKKWTVYQCIYAEVTERKKEYVLSNGRWYQIDSSYVQAVNASVASIPDFAMTLPDYQDATEGAYNARIAADHPNDFFLMDRNLVQHGGNRSSFEFCDIVSARRQLLHVKNYGGSAVLSHLFAQGLNSARLFLRDADFRSKLHHKLPEQVRGHFPTTRPDASQFEIVYAIVSDSDSPIKQSLPFFSRMNLHAAVADLSMYGLRVSIAKIRDRGTP